MLEAKISYEAPAVWKREIIDRYGARIKVLDWLSDEQVCCKVFVEIVVAPDVAEKVLSELLTNPAIVHEDLQVVGPGRIKGAISTDECLGCCSAADTGIFQINGVMDRDGRIVQTVAAETREEVERMVSSMEAHGHVVTLLKLADLDIEDVLTARQEEILLFALERGYFDDPKGITLSEVADEFDVSVSTASEMLRKSQRKVLGEFFKARA